MGCIFHSQADKHPSCAVLGLSGYEQNRRDPQGSGWVWTKLDLSQTISRFQPLSNWLNWSWLSSNPPTMQAIILFIINQNNNVEWRNSLSMCPEVSQFYIVLFSNSDMNIEMQLCGQQAKQLWEQKTSVFAVWKYWSVSQATSLFWCFSSYCVDYYWSWWKWRFPGIKHWCFTDAALLHINVASYVIAHRHNRQKRCGMKDISIDANLIEQWLNIVGDFSCVLCCVITYYSSFNDYASYFIFIMQICSIYSEADFKCLLDYHIFQILIPWYISILTVMCMMSCLSDHWQQILDTFYFLFLSIFWWCVIKLGCNCTWPPSEVFRLIHPTHPPLFFPPFFARGADVPFVK